MLRLAAKVISILFHPVFAPLFSLYILFSFPTYINFRLPANYVIYIYVVVIVNLVAVPISLSYYLKKKQYIYSLEMDSVKERIMPYSLSLIFYVLTWFLLRKIQFPAYYLAVFQMAGVTILTLLFLALSKQKVSAHMAAWGGICGMIITAAFILEIDSSNFLIVAVLLSGLVAFSRLYLKAHKVDEIITGFLLGLSLQLFLLI